MGKETSIEWCDASFSPWIGCTKVSAGCKNCYAENTTRARVLRSQGQETWGKGAQRSRTSVANWRQPLRWNSEAAQSPSPTRPRIFPSLCDWLDEEVPIEWLADFLMLVIDTPNLDWLLLTKRPENVERINQALKIANWGDRDKKALWNLAGLVPHNVWLGTSVENQAMADIRIPQLLATPAKIRFLSVEPMLEKINLIYSAFNGADAIGSMEGIHWVIFGGESGTGARWCNIEWIRDGVRQCQEAGVPVFVKQLGSHAFQRSCNSPQFFPMKLRDKKGGDISEWPEDLRVRQFPERTP